MQSQRPLRIVGQTSFRVVSDLHYIPGCEVRAINRLIGLWAAVAERRFFELMTERKNGGKSRGRPRRGEGVRGFSREDGIKGVWGIFSPPNS